MTKTLIWNQSIFVVCDVERKSESRWIHSNDKRQAGDGCQAMCWGGRTWIWAGQSEITLKG